MYYISVTKCVADVYQILGTLIELHGSELDTDVNGNLLEDTKVSKEQCSDIKAFIDVYKAMVMPNIKEIFVFHKSCDYFLSVS